jgi:hypothetical protein
MAKWKRGECVCTSRQRRRSYRWAFTISRGWGRREDREEPSRAEAAGGHVLLFGGGGRGRETWGDGSGRRKSSLTLRSPKSTRTAPVQGPSKHCDGNPIHRPSNGPSWAECCSSAPQCQRLGARSRGKTCRVTDAGSGVHRAVSKCLHGLPVAPAVGALQVPLSRSDCFSSARPSQSAARELPALLISPGNRALAVLKWRRRGLISQVLGTATSTFAPLFMGDLFSNVPLPFGRPTSVVAPASFAHH